MSDHALSSHSRSGAHGERTASHLSYSRVSRYLQCPEQYRLYYVEGLRPELPSASLEFGQVIHQVLADQFQTGCCPVASFREAWRGRQQMPLRYGFRESWQRLHEKGEVLLTKFSTEVMPRITEVRASELPFEITVSNLDLSFVGVIDLLAQVDGKLTVVDFKTSSSTYQEFEVEMSDQLTAYQLAEPSVVRSALCVMVKSADPHIDWYFTRRSGNQLLEYLQKVALVGGQIAQNVFYKRPGKWCAQCDYLTSCLSTDK